MAVPFQVVFLADHPRPTRRQGSGGGPPPQDLRTAGQPPDTRSPRSARSALTARAPWRPPKPLANGTLIARAGEDYPTRTAFDDRTAYVWGKVVPHGGPCPRWQAAGAARQHVTGRSAGRGGRAPGRPAAPPVPSLKDD